MFCLNVNYLLKNTQKGLFCTLFMENDLIFSIQTVFEINYVFHYPPSLHPYIQSVHEFSERTHVMMCHADAQVIPPYNGFGSLEDSLQNCLALVPEPPKKDVIKLLENNLKVLRYIARLVRMHLICIISKRSIALKQRRQREQINVCS